MQRFLSRLALTSSPLTIIFSLLVLGLGVAITPAEAQISMYKTLGDYPGTTGVTSAHGINDAQQVVGSYSDGSHTHGFLLSGSVYSAIEPPGAVQSTAMGINNAGQVVGYYDDVNYNRHGFLLSGGKYSTIDFTGAAGTIANGINNNGAIAGVYWGATTPQYGFLLAAGVFTTIDTFGRQPTVGSINDSGVVDGYYSDTQGINHGFLFSNGQVTSFDFPSSTTYYDVSGIDNNGDIVGSYAPGTNYDGYINKNGSYSQIAFPSAAATWAKGINNGGTIVGYYKNVSDPSDLLP